MKLKRKIAGPLFDVAGFCLLFTLACNNDKTIPLSSGLADPTQLGQRRQTAVTINIDSTANKKANTFGTSDLWLGKFDNIESRMLMRFAPIDTGVTVIAGTLKLHTNLLKGNGVSFNATIHEVTNSWDSTKFTSQDDIVQKDLFKNAPMDIQRVNPEKTDSLVFKLDPAVVSSWRTKAGREKGVLIQTSGATFIKSFNSNLSAQKPPVFELITLKRGNTKNDTTRLTASAAVFIFQRTGELRQGPIYVGLGEQHQSVLFFDVTAIPPNTTISRALLTLEVDTLNSIFYSNRLDLQLAYPIDPDSTKDYKFDPLRFGSLSAALRTAALDTVNISTKMITFTVTNPVQLWVSDSKKNFGVNLFPISFTGRDLTRAAFYSRETDAARAPKLQIEYTVPPQ